jgi:hypothetical protein
MFPKISVTATAGYDPNGFCQSSAFGVQLEVDLGAELELEGWTELDGKRNVLFDVDLFKKNDIYEFPPLCIGLGSDNPGTCLAYPRAGDQVWWDNEVKLDNETDTTALSLRRRQEEPEEPEERNGRGYKMNCEGSTTDPKIVLIDYPSAGELFGLGKSPVLEPGIPRCGTTKYEQCTKDKWFVKPPSPPNRKNFIYNGKVPTFKVFTAR